MKHKVPIMVTTPVRNWRQALLKAVTKLIYVSTNL